MGTTLHWPALITLAALALLFGCAWYVGHARGRWCHRRMIRGRAQCIHGVASWAFDKPGIN